MSHAHPHHHVHDQSFWDDMYRNRTAPWDPDPNPFLPEDLAGLQPGTALDVGCGEGSDAVWLAKQGWQVTAVDLSEVALERARAADTQQLVSWQQADILKWAPPADSYDLVTSHFLHFPPAERARLFGDLARAVRPGGTLLIVAHHVSDLQTTVGRPPLPELFFEADEVAAALPAGRWEVLVAGTRPRETHDREGRTVTIHDMVLKAKRTS